MRQSVLDIAGLDSLKSEADKSPEKLVFLYFYAEWNEDSVELSKILKEYFQGYASDCIFCFVDSDLEANLDLCSRYQIETVPAAIMVTSDMHKIKAFDIIDPITIYEAIEGQIVIAKQNFEVEKMRALHKIEKIAKDNKVVLFTEDGVIRGKETSEMVLLLEGNNVRFEVLNLADKVQDNLAKWVKMFSGVERLPVLFVNSKLVGDISKVRQSLSIGELLTLIPKECIGGDPKTEFESIVAEEKLILFVNSDFEGQEGIASKCDTCLKQLQLKGLIFRTYDVKGKPQILEIAKSTVGGSFSLPYLFKDGKQFDGGDSLLEKAKGSDLKVLFEERLFREDAFSQIRRLVNSYPVFAFIKGTPEDPQCGFTGQLVNILSQFKIDYKTYNILEDHMIREKIKEFANWKTFPQVYCKGQLIGGLDIIKELIEDGVFEETIKGQ